MSRSMFHDHFFRRARTHRPRIFGIQLRRSLHRALHFEPLEDRRLLATFDGIPEWTPLGPAPIGPTIGSANDNVKLWSAAGAIGPIAVHPSDPAVLYVGSVNGGVWKTENATYSRGDGIDNDSDGIKDAFDLDEVPHWRPLTDDFSTPIGALAFDPIDSSHETLWAGNARYSSLDHEGVPRGGLLRTVDGGNTWTELGRATFQNVNVESIVPTELTTPAGQLLLAATSDGVWRTADGGQTWARVLNGNATGLVRDPSATDRFFAAVVGQGVFRSAAGQADHSNSGTVWNAVNNDANLVAKIAGAARIGLAATSAGSGAVFAATVAAGITGVFETINAGAAWDEIDVPAGRTTVEGANAGFRHFGMTADPNNQRRAFVSGFRSVAVGDGQTDTWSLLNPLGGTVPGYQVLNTNGYLHDDVRGLAVDLNGNLLLSSDGGIYRINDPFNDSQRYSESINGDLQITETNSQYSLAYDSLNDVVVLGTQDVGTIMQTGGSSRVYSEQTAGDGNSALVEVDGSTGTSYRYVADNNWKSLQRLKYDDKNQLVGDPQNLGLAASADGARYSGLTRGNDEKISSNAYVPGFPFVLNEVTPSRLVLGTGNGLYESMDRGNTIVDVTPGGVNRNVTAVAYGGWLAGSPNADVIYAGASNQMWLRTSAASGFGQPLASYTGSTPIDIVLDPLDWRNAYVLDVNSRIWRTTSAGGAWTDVTVGANLPPLHSIEFARIGGTPVLVAGGEGGVFRRINPAIATDWSEFGRGLPNVIVKDVVYDDADDVLLAGTVGRGVWKIEVADAFLPVASTLTVNGDLTDDGVFDFPDRPDVIRIAQNPTHDDWLDIFVNHIGGAAEYSVEYAAVESIVVNAKGGGDFVQVDYLPPQTGLQVYGGTGRDVFNVASADVHSVIELFGDADPDWFRVTPNTNADISVSGGSPAAPVVEGDALSVITGGNPFTDTPGPQAGDGFVFGTGFNLIRYFQTEDVYLDGPDWRQDVLEPNDTFVGAADLLVGSQARPNLTIHESFNDDWFKWTATSGNANLAISLYFEHDLGDLDLALYDASQTFLTSSTSVSDYEGVVWSAAQGQTYYIRVYGYAGATNPNYILRISWPPGFPDDGFEQNDTFGQAYNLGSGDQTHTGLAITRIPGSEFTSDDDWYQWKATADGVLTVDAKFLHALGNLDLKLYNSSQVLLDSSTSTDDDEQVSAFVLGGQTYYIHVYGLAGAGNPAYELAIDGPEIPPDVLYGTGNDTAKKAKNLGAGELYLPGLSIHQPGEDDWFVWRADAAGALTVDVTFEHDLGDLDVQLLDANLTQLDLSQGTGDSEQVSYDVQAGQSYYIRVYGYQRATNYNYTLSITWPPAIPQDALEPNDSFPSARYLGQGDQLREGLTIHPVGEFQSSDDWYRWRASRDGILDVSVLFLDAPGDVDLALYDSSQTLLTSSTSSTDNEAVRWQVQAAQDYYIRVYGYNGARNADYDLVIDGPDILQDVFEPNNSRLDAYNIGMGDQAYEGLTLHAPSNEDWYLWTAPVNGTLTVDVQFAHALGDVDLQLYDAAGGLLDSSTSTTDSEQVTQAVVAGDGYYLRVFGYNGATNPSYTLLIDGPNVVPDVLEPNDSIDTATDLGGSSQTLMNLTIHQPGNNDWFAWTAPENGTLTVRAAFAHELGDVDLELYDDQGSLVTSSVSTTDAEQVSSSVEAGRTYYVRVFGASMQYIPKMLRGSSVTIQSGALCDDYMLAVSFVATTLLTGDYNNNRIVDAADYTVWRDNLGANIALPNEDPNQTPGWVTAEDYGVWKAHFGQTLPLPAAAAGGGSATAAAVVDEVVAQSSDRATPPTIGLLLDEIQETFGQMQVRGSGLGRELGRTETRALQGETRAQHVRVGSPDLLRAVPRGELLLAWLSPAADDDDQVDENPGRIADRKDREGPPAEVRERVFELIGDLEELRVNLKRPI